MNKIHLSKSKYCQGIQCEKILWLSEYKPKAAAAKNNESVFENGRQVGEIAKGMFGDYEDIPFNKNLSIMIEKTDKLLEDKPNIITEASFSFDNNFCSVDILKNDEDGVEIYEVKSSASIKDIYYDDAAYQYFVLSNLGLNVKKVSIVYLNSEYYRRTEELDLKKLFKKEDVTSQVKEKQNQIRNKIDFINNYMESHDADNEPDKQIGNYCCNPYPCDFWQYCNGGWYEQASTPSTGAIGGMYDQSITIDKMVQTVTNEDPSLKRFFQLSDELYAHSDDATDYLKLYNTTAHGFARMLIQDVLRSGVRNRP